ncbi:MAG TPA: hypothetical protein VGZ26_12505 [Pirellulales bacterium]|jgi:hypothetical protein|nr:hypothetical protein [Pirellulales bacterium]
MSYRGHIKDGVAVLDTPITLPDGTPVRVVVDRVDSDFWREKTVEDLAREQGVGPVGSLDTLAIDWPAEDSVDDLVALIREVRR